MITRTVFWLLEKQFKLPPLAFASLFLYSIIIADIGRTNDSAAPRPAEKPSMFYTVDAPIFWLSQGSEGASARIHFLSFLPSGMYSVRIYSNYYVSDSYSPYQQTSRDLAPALYLREIIFPFHFFW